jgi:high-affinity iron transporter
MLPSFLLSLREGLEAALIIGIVLGALGRLNRSDLKPVVWRGVTLALVLSLLAGIGLNLLGMKFEGRAEEIFEGTAMLLAAGVLTWMILWMQQHGREIKQHLETKTRQAAMQKSQRPLFLLAFLAVFREGVELALFLLAASLASGLTATLVGGILGLGVAILLGWMLFTSTRRLSLRAFFQVTSILLILFAAGLVGLGVHEFSEAGLIPPLVEHVYDINSIIDENSQLGLILKALLGYNGNPSLIEVIAYSGYFITLGWFTLRNQRGQGEAGAQPA